jgi:DNA-binding NtrC family response regulator
MSRILIVEDHRVTRDALKAVLVESSFSVSVAVSVEEATSKYDLDDFDVILTDVRLRSPEGRELADGTRLIDLAPNVPVIVMTAFGTISHAVDAMRSGAADYIPKPFENDELRFRIRRLLEVGRMRRKLDALERDIALTYPVSELQGRSAVMQAMLKRVAQSARTDATILISGESGTGKELIARAIHQGSERRSAPFVAINCGAIAEGLVSAELFGVEKGAYTDAVPRKGVFERASGGTLFLDEIGELPLGMQPQLLRVLDGNEVHRVGAQRPRIVDVRLVAATNRNLTAMVAEGGFRRDLFERLKRIPITVPPLRERGDDIDLLADHFLEESRAKLGKPSITLNAEARRALRAYHWPGNVRELRNAIERAVITCEEDLITPDELMLDDYLPPGSPHNDAGGNDSIDAHIRRVIHAQQGRLGEVELARLLGISRTTLHRKRKRLGISRPAAASDGAGRRS